MLTLHYFKEVCPQCKELSPYVPNPYYIHECKCGFKGKESDLISVIDDGAVNEDIDELKRLLIGNKKLSEVKNS